MSNRLAQLRSDRGWKKVRLLRELRTAAVRRGVQLPKDESLGRRVAVWENQGGAVGDFYRDLLCEVYGVSAFELGLVDPALVEETATTVGELPDRPAFTRLDAGLVELLRGQTQSIRLLDRRLGGAAIYHQTTGHVDSIEDLMRYALPGAHREAAADELVKPPHWPAGRHSTWAIWIRPGTSTRRRQQPHAKAARSRATPMREHNKDSCSSMPGRRPTPSP
ncbi:hypothetical protein [Pseudonocardia sp. T1-2H]|uniref:hypothetical protein n=1 Tax=Pseudonocardia sp. T1-2H TaxID=3128899 RepID=UPI003100B4CD